MKLSGHIMPQQHAALYNPYQELVCGYRSFSVKSCVKEDIPASSAFRCHACANEIDSCKELRDFICMFLLHTVNRSPRNTIQQDFCCLNVKRSHNQRGLIRISLLCPYHYIQSMVHTWIHLTKVVKVDRGSEHP